MFGISEAAVAWAWSYAIFLASYWGLGLLLEVLPGRFLPPKIQPDVQLTREQVWKIASRVLCAHLTIYPVGFVLTFPLACSRLRWGTPSALDVVREVAALAALTEIFFYCGHRTLHHPWLYKRVHKMHHEWKAPIGIAALYFHPVEHLHTLFDALGPGLLLGVHLRTLQLFTFISTTNVVLHHSGRLFPLDRLPPFDSMTLQHDEHHKYFDGNYGVLGVMDSLCGTTTAALLESRKRRQKAA